MTEQEEFEFRARMESEQGAAPKAPSQQTVGQTLNKDVKEDWTKAAQAGIARSAMKTVRGLGTTLLPKSMEGWLPSERDIALLEEGTKGSGIAGAAELIGDIATAAVPAAGGMKLATAAKQALPMATGRAAKAVQAAIPIGIGAGTGAATEAILAEGPDVGDAALRGAALGGLGEAGGQVLGKVLGKAVPTTQATKDLMARGVTPTMGQGADPSTWRGTILKAGEEMSQYAPISGTTLRSARDNASRQVLDEAAKIVDPSIAAMPKSAQELVEQLRSTTKAGYSGPLHEVRMPVNDKGVAALNSRVDELSTQFSLNPRDTAKLKAQIEDTLSGVRGGSAPANVIENMASDLAAGGGSKAEQQVRFGMAKYLRENVDLATEAAGRPMKKAREARQGYYVIKRSVPTKSAGVSGEQLLSAIRKNDEKMGAMLTPELRTLAEQSIGVAPASRAFGASNPARALAGALDIGSGIGTGGLATAALLGYGKAQGGALGRLLMGDKATQQAFAEALRNPAIAASLLGSSGE
jgi:hypothetical protein